MERFGFDLGREGVDFAKGTWRAMDFRFPKKGKEKMKIEGMSVVEVLDLEVLQSLGLGSKFDSDFWCVFCGGVGFGGSAKIFAIIELKETFFFFLISIL